MKRLLYFMIFVTVVITSCLRTADEQSDLFIIPEMNEKLRGFVRASESNSPEHQYQIIIGGNRLGAKVSLIEGVNGPLLGCLYWWDYQEPEYLGYYILGCDSISVYASPRDIVRNYIYESALKQQTLKTVDSEVDNNRIRGKYYQITDGVVKELFQNTMDMKRTLFHYVDSNQEKTSHLLILASEPPYYEMISSSIVVFGTWDYSSKHSICLKPFKIFQYSEARNDLAEISLEWEKNLTWDSFGECLGVSLYQVEDERLIPVDAPTEATFYWALEKW